MNKYNLILSIGLLINILLSPTLASDTFEKPKKLIWIDQLKQVGAAYENEKKVMEFPVFLLRLTPLRTDMQIKMD